jgi:uncharacterized protein (DUF983 family)
MTDAAQSHDDDRPTRPALLRGLSRRCPACGRGAMFEGFLKVRDACPACGEVLRHHRADDGPAYLTILIVGHLTLPLMMWAFVAWRPDPLLLAGGFAAACVALSLFLLPRMKGMIVAVQWAKRMHGFGTAPGGADV